MGLQGLFGVLWPLQIAYVHFISVSIHASLHFELKPDFGISVRQRVYVYVCACVGSNSGARSAWMSLIVPVRPSDNAGGQIGMKPEQGDSDKQPF